MECHYPPPGVAICEHRDFNVVSCSDRRFSAVVSLDLVLPDAVLLYDFVIIMRISVSRVTVAVQSLSLGDSFVFVPPLGVAFLSLPLGGLVVSFSLMETSKNTTHGNFKEHNSLNLSAKR